MAFCNSPIEEGWGTRILGGGLRRRRDRLLDLAEPLLAEEHLAADEERRNAEDAARNRRRGVVGELLLHRVALRRSQKARGIEPSRVHPARQHIRIVELEPFLPHALQ